MVVDDDRDMANLVCDVLRQVGYNALSANSGSEALEIVKREIPDALISDLRMSGMNGHQLQQELKRLIPDLPVIIITAFGSIQSAVDAMKLGAFDYITKPFGILGANGRCPRFTQQLRGALDGIAMARNAFAHFPDTIHRTPLHAGGFSPPCRRLDLRKTGATTPYAPGGARTLLCRRFRHSQPCFAQP